MNHRYLKKTMDVITAAMFIILMAVIVTGPFIVHIVQCVKDDWAAMLIIGLVIPPVGWIHGVGIILGIWG